MCIRDRRYTVEDTDAEWHRFKGAQTGAIEQLGVLAEQARKEAGDEAAMLFETHQMMAEDLDFEEAIEDLSLIHISTSAAASAARRVASPCAICLKRPACPPPTP